MIKKLWSHHTSSCSQPIKSSNNYNLYMRYKIEVKSHTNAFEYLEWNSGLYWMKRIQIPHSALLPQLTLTLTVRQRRGKRRKVEIYLTSYHGFGSWGELLSITFMSGKDHLFKLVEFSHMLYKRGSFDDVQNCNQFDTHGLSHSYGP